MNRYRIRFYTDLLNAALDLYENAINVRDWDAAHKARLRMQRCELELQVLGLEDEDVAV